MSKHNKYQKQLARQNQTTTASFQITAAGVHFSGPLPHPDILVKYNEAHPGSADRIIAMAESQAKHRQDLEKNVVLSNCHAQKMGPIYGFIVCMTAIVCGTYLIHSGKSGEGLAAIVTALASLSVVFIYGRKKQEKDLKEKADAIAAIVPHRP